MRLDIRTPIGGLFATFGVILILTGIFTLGHGELYARSLGINLNLWWGLVMLAFGAIMLALGHYATRKRRTEDPAP